MIPTCFNTEHKFGHCDCDTPNTNQCASPGERCHIITGCKCKCSFSKRDAVDRMEAEIKRLRVECDNAREIMVAQHAKVHDLENELDKANKSLNSAHAFVINLCRSLTLK